MHVRGGFGQEFFHVSGSLASALLVLDKRKPDIAFAIFAETHARRDRDARFFEQKL
jgi:hypothetical protein